MILEGIVTTRNEDRSTNASPMGPLVDATMTQLTLRPFQTSTTYANLKRNGEGILHVTDDAELLAYTAVGAPALPSLQPCELVDVDILTDACRWYAFRVERLDEDQDRTTIECTVVGSGRLRDFFGWNRAKHAVLEAAILATRVHILPGEEIRDQFKRLRVIVEKTAGESEARAFRYLSDYVEDATAKSSTKNA